MARERLDKVLGHMGIASRKELKAMIKQRRITVDGELANDPGQQVESSSQIITVDGNEILFQRHFYVMLHKPSGVITATEDKRQHTVFDVLPPAMVHRDLFPVGRLDKDTEGLLLLTTDGDLGHRLLAPKWHVDKSYLAHLDRPVDPADVKAFFAGVTIDLGYTCLPARLEILDGLEALVTVQEGKFHQIKRMFEARGKQVTYLKRLSMGPLRLGDLPHGEARSLTTAEVALLYDAVGLVVP
jgi:16S rRNA pseudouridine516 synthase